MLQYGLIVLMLITASHESNSILSQVQRITAAHLHKSPADMLPSKTFESLGADDLDIVEITMKVENELSVTIADSELTKAAGISQNENLSDKLTLQSFAHVVSTAPKRKKSSAHTQSETSDGNLREAEVGTFEQLNRKANPRGYVLVFVPRLEVILEREQQRLGRKLSEQDILLLKNKAAVIALPPAAAEEMRRKQAQSLR
jgi:acyl carrier protein